MKTMRGFTLVEVMVSMVLISFAAVFSMMVIKVVAQRQAEIRIITQYTLVTKSLKSGFNEYVNSVDPASIINGETLACANYGPSATGKNKMTTLICSKEDQLSTTLKKTKKIDLPINVILVNGVYYFSGRIRIRGVSCTLVDPNDPSVTDICLDRILVNQQ